MKIRLYLIVLPLLLIHPQARGMEKIKKFITTKKEESHTRKLFRAVQSSKFITLQTLLKKPITNLQALEANGTTLLHAAAEQTESIIVALLLAHGTEINAQDAHGNTPLQRALQTKPRNHQVIACLLSNCARIDIPNNNGQIAYMRKVIHKYFVNAILRKDYPLVSRYLLQGAPLNTPVPHFAFGYEIDPIYPLECALSSPERSQEMVTFLINAGADVKVCDMNRILGIRNIPQWPRRNVLLHLATYLPRPLIKQWNANALLFIACLKRMPALYADIRHLLCYYYIRNGCFEEQRKTVKTISSKISPKRMKAMLGNDFAVL